MAEAVTALLLEQQGILQQLQQGLERYPPFAVSLPRAGSPENRSRRRPRRLNLVSPALQPPGGRSSCAPAPATPPQLATARPVTHAEVAAAAAAAWEPSPPQRQAPPAVYAHVRSLSPARTPPPAADAAPPPRRPARDVSPEHPGSGCAAAAGEAADSGSGAALAAAQEAAQLRTALREAEQRRLREEALWRQRCAVLEERLAGCAVPTAGILPPGSCATEQLFRSLARIADIATAVARIAGAELPPEAEEL
eukprot:TRINITY_DN4901_c0_g1_i1.p2 TRINITY_DN4901_c0_g1~~TRINITY_DN4901_c0_g1_i1.p2  ORF type:complete len:279 (+),score=74.00 TRINITY_DN4901_c0_g1_i1:82-837(+)